MSVGKGSNAISLDLYEARAAEKKTEFQSILFRLANKCSSLRSELSTANQQLEALKNQKSSSKGLDALMDLGPKKPTSTNVPKQSKVGMSVINPSSRKRKAATGVVFGD